MIFPNRRLAAALFTGALLAAAPAFAQGTTTDPSAPPAASTTAPSGNAMTAPPADSSTSTMAPKKSMKHTRHTKRMHKKSTAS